jgi:hypothetical protein
LYVEKILGKNNNAAIQINKFGQVFQSSFMSLEEADKLIKKILEDESW